MTLADQILEACQSPAGMSRFELVELIGKRDDTIGATLTYLMSRGRIFRAGFNRHYRHFVSKEHADAWDLVAEADYRARQAESKAANQHKAVMRRRIKRGTVKAYKPRTARTELVIKQERADLSEATVIWPEYVKVQVHPTPRGRFEFVPEPGWRGAITSDWIDRRLQGAGA